MQQTAHFAQFNKEVYKKKLAMRLQAPRWPRLGHHMELARKRPCTSTVHFSGTALHTQNFLEHSDSHMQPHCAYSHTSSLASTSVHTLALGEKPLFIGSLVQSDQEQRKDLCNILQGASTTPHTVLCVFGIICNTHTVKHLFRS